MPREDDNEYPRTLDDKGCIFGRNLEEKMEAMKDRLMEKIGEADERTQKIEDRLGKQTTALWIAAVSFAVTAIFLALNLVLP